MINLDTSFIKFDLIYRGFPLVTELTELMSVEIDKDESTEVDEPELMDID